MSWIISILIIILTLSILKDTHVKEYRRGLDYYGVELQKEYDFKVKVWTALIIIILGLIPIFNMVMFISFTINYIIHATWNPKERAGYTHVFLLKGTNIVTKILLKIKGFLCKAI